MNTRTLTPYVVAGLTVLLFLGNATNDANADGSYQPTWESLATYPIPDWFQDGKFGIYTHWGIYSVPAHVTEWYPHGMYMKDGFRNKDFYGWHTEHFGPPEKFGYKDFLPQFTGEKFDADDWAELFRQAGAKFAGPCAEHHDGFAMWDSALTEWDAADKGPKVDVTGKLAEAINKRGMKFLATFHHARNWQYYPHEGDFDTNDPKYAYLGSIYGPIHKPGEPPSKEYLEDWRARVVEVIDKYDPDMLWFDGGWGRGQYDPYKRELLAYYYNRAEAAGKQVAVAKKGEDLPKGVGVLNFERGRAEGILERPWETDTSVYQNSWGYINDIKYYPADYLIDELIDIVSKNGVMLLNVGPRPDGTIPDEARQVLLDIGRWLDVNGEAIYGTRPWKVFGEGPTKVGGGKRVRREVDYTANDIRFTTRGETLYAICLDWPGAQLVVESLGSRSTNLKGKITAVTLVGHSENLVFAQEERGLVVTMPDEKPCECAYALRITWR
jgi:alpha-L-fucosidase